METNEYGLFDPNGKYLQLKEGVTEEEILDVFDDSTVDSAYYFNQMYIKYILMSRDRIEKMLSKGTVPEEDAISMHKALEDSNKILSAVKRTTKLIEGIIPEHHRDKITIDAHAAAVHRFMSPSKEAKERENKESSN